MFDFLNIHQEQGESNSRHIATAVKPTAAGSQQQQECQQQVGREERRQHPVAEEK
jgi:hypothetical protein